VDGTANDNFKFNQETEFVPILGLIESQLNDAAGDSAKSLTNEPVIVTASSIQNNHHPALISVLADHLSVKKEAIHDFELFVFIILTSVEIILKHLQSVV
jgi:aspartyl aminopeptidase